MDVALINQTYCVRNVLPVETLLRIKVAYNKYCTNSIAGNIFTFLLNIDSAKHGIGGCLKTCQYAVTQFLNKLTVK